MATATASKTAIWAPSRPKSVDPSLARSRSPSTSQSRPPLPTHTSSSTFASFSSFSSSFTNSHMRSASGSNGNSDKSGNPKWIQRSVTPGPLNSHSRTRSGTGSSDAVPPLPTSAVTTSGKSHHRKTSNASSTQPPRPSSTAPEGTNPGQADDNWKARIHQEALARYRDLAKLADAERQNRINTLSRNGVRPSTPSGLPNEHYARMEEEYRKYLLDLQRKTEEDITTAIKKEEKRRRRLSRSERDRPSLMTGNKGVIVEDEDSFVLIGPQSPAEQEEWLWRPDEFEAVDKVKKGRRRGSIVEDDRHRWREAIRQEQQVLLNSITARNGQGHSPPNQSSSGFSNRKVHWAGNGGPPPTGRSGSPAPPPPQLPHTPHTAGTAHARPMSAAPVHSHSLSQSQTYGSGFRPISPAVAMTRPGSARPSSPAFGLREKEKEGHARWIPSDRQRSAARPIPGRNVSSTNHHVQDAKDSEGSVGSGSMGSSWRDWKGPALPPKDVQHVNVKETPPSRRAMTPAPGMTSSASKYALAQSTGVPPVPGTARMRTLSFNAPSSNPLNPNAGNNNSNVPSGRPAPTVIPPTSVYINKGKGKTSPVVVDDRDDPEEDRIPPPRPVTAAPMMTRSSSGLPESDEPPPEQVARRKDKGKGKAPAPPAMETGRNERGKGLYGLYTAQLEDFASVLKRELSIASEA